MTSEPGRGTTFTLLFLHVADCPQSMAQTLPAATRQGTETVFGRRRTSGAHDGSADARTPWLSCIRSLQCQAALQMMQSFREPIHLLVTDVVMPEIGAEN